MKYNAEKIPLERGDQMSMIQIQLPPELADFALAQAQSAGHGDVNAYLVELVRKSKAKADLEAKLLVGLDQLDRGEGRTLTSQDWENIRHDFRKRHGITDEA